MLMKFLNVSRPANTTARFIHPRRFAGTIVGGTALLILSCVLLCSACGIQASPRSAFPRQEQPAQTAVSTLAAISVMGSARFSSAQIAPFTGMTVGQVVGRETFQQAADHLSALGCFSSVRYTFSSKSDSVSVEFQVADAPSVPVTFDNFPWLADTDILAALKGDITLFDGALPTHGALPGMVADTLSKLLAAQNVKGTIQYHLQAMPESDQQVMRFRVEGPSITVAGVQFGDALAQHDTSLQDRLPDVVGKPYSRYTMEVFNLEQVRPLYLQHGFLHVHFDPVQAHFSGDVKQPLPGAVLVTDPIEPGPTFAWGGAKWIGNLAFSAPQLDAVLPLHPGDFADGLKIAAGWESVRAQYGAAGYLDLLIEPVEAFDNDRNRAVYFVKITEGPQYRMGDLVLTGLSLAAERRIRASWKIATGAPFDLGYLNDFLASGARQALTALPVHIEQIGHFLRTNPQTATVDVLLDFQ
jgi:outer membrane protein assembly factor BamA